MIRSTYLLRTVGVSLALLSTSKAESLLPPESISLNSLESFTTQENNWVIASGLAGNPREEPTLEPIPGTGVVVNTAPRQSGKHLVSNWDHADLELSLEYLLPPESNSGVYLMGRYEIQLFDSWGVAEPTMRDAGAVYARWDKEAKTTFEGQPPNVNAARAPGLWQTLHIVFQAPRFDEDGTKTSHARFVRVEHNGYLIHEDVDVTGPTRAAMFGDEATRGPLMIQGDHGPVALRNIQIKHIDFATQISAHDVTYQVRQNPESYDDEEESPFADEVAADHLDPADVGETRNFTARFSGKFTVPTTGTYAFDGNTGGTSTFRVNGQPVLVPVNPGMRSIPIELEAGEHEFDFEYTQGRWGRPRMAVFVEGPGIARHRFETAAQQESALDPVDALTAAMMDEEEPVEDPDEESREDYVAEPSTDRVRVQRGFTPFDPIKRLYSIAVGDPVGVHYAYDFDTATVLRVWNGPFLDTWDFWRGRAHDQYLTPTGPSLTFHDDPTIALLESGEHDWPSETDAMWRSTGYTLNERGEPTFFAELSGLEIEDHISVTAAPRSLQRTLVFTGDHTAFMTGVLLAEADSITAQADGMSYIIGDRHYYIDVAADNAHQPFIRHINGRDQLILYVPKWEDEVTLSYSIIW